MAHKKTGGSTRNGRDSNPKMLGVKIADGQTAYPGNIIARQRGTKFRNGKNVKRGNDDTLYAIKTGKVKFTKKYRRSHYNNKKKIVTYVEIAPQAEKKIA